MPCILNVFREKGSADQVTSCVNPHGNGVRQQKLPLTCILPCRNLDPVTQLYVSVDAATRDSLKAVDRPLFKDFWERFQLCLQLLKAKQQRTVYR